MRPVDVVTDLTLYQSRTDAALAVSRFVFGRERIGQVSNEAGSAPAAQARLAGMDRLHVIDVTDAESAGVGNGHWYFQSSPWASSDLFLSLLTDKGPAERGLTRIDGEVAWRFPADYADRISTITLSN